MTRAPGDIFDVALIPFGPQVADRTSKDFVSFVFVCLCVPFAIPAILLVWRCVVVFTVAVSFLAMGADERSKGEGWKTQRRGGWMSGQLRRKSFSRRSSPSMGERSGTGTCWQDGNVGGVSDKHSVSVAREAQASRLHGAGGAHRDSFSRRSEDKCVLDPTDRIACIA